MNIKIDIDKNKLEALRCYMPAEQNVEEEIVKVINEAAATAVDKLYSKHVPKAVQGFIKRSAALKSDKKKKDENIEARQLSE